MIYDYLIVFVDSISPKVNFDILRMWRLSFGIGQCMLSIGRKKTAPEGAAKGGVRVLIVFGLCSFVACVDVFITHDVILSEVGAGLHFDEVQRDFPRVFQPVYRAKWDVHGLIF